MKLIPNAPGGVSIRILLALGGIGLALAGVTAQAGQGPQPAICSRACWGARAPTCGITQMGSLTRAIVHHTAGTGDYSTDLNNSKAKIRGIQNLHINNGWCDIAYHFLVDAAGNIFEGRSGAWNGLPRGTHDGCNNNSFGFTALGYYHPPYNQVFTSATRNALEAVIAWRMPSAWSPYNAGTYCSKSVGFMDGHYRVSATACPGDGIISQIPGMRDGVNHRKNSGGCDINMTQGAIRQKYESLGGCSSFLGAPTTTEQTTPDGIGRYNHFQNNGSIYWTQGTGAWEVHGSIRDKWAALGWETSFLGYPTSDERGGIRDGGRYNHFQRGSIYWTSFTGAHNVQGEIHNKWAELGWENSYLGYPTTDEQGGIRDGGRYNHFERGSIYWTSFTGAHNVQGLIRDKWAELGWENSYLGYPITDELGGIRDGGRYNHFERGSIYWTSFTGAHNVQGLIRDKWAELGWENSFLGYPTSDEGPAKDGGRYNHFERGSIYWHPSTGAHNVQGEIHKKWVSMGYEYSALGYPISDEYAYAGGFRSDFQGGFIYWSASTGAFASTELPPQVSTGRKTDFNGDGKSDVITFVRGSNNAAGHADGDVYVTLSTGAAFGGGQKWHEFFAGNHAVPDTGDFNGDGKTDIISFSRGGTNSAAGHGDGDVFVALSTGSSFGTAGKWHEFCAPLNAVPAVGDVNGDGKDDIVYFTRGNDNAAGAGDVYVALSTGSGFGAVQKWHDWFCVGGEVPAVADVNGDGKADVVTLVRGGGNNGANVPDGDVIVSLSTGTAFGGGAKWHEFFCFGNEVPALGDINGDGKADLLTFLRSSQSGTAEGDIYISLSTGSAFTGGGAKWADWFCIGNELPGVGDFTGDGKADAVSFVRSAATGTPEGDVFVAPSTGSAFSGGGKWHDWFCIGKELAQPASNLDGK